MEKFFYWFNHFSVLLGLTACIIFLCELMLPESSRTFICLPLCFILGLSYSRIVWPRIEKFFGFERE